MLARPQQRAAAPVRPAGTGRSRAPGPRPAQLPLLSNQGLQHLLLAGGAVQRKCDPAVVDPRTAPVFFPQEPKIVEVFNGVSTLEKFAPERAAVGLVQQALADLCFPTGTSGKNKDGTDRKFGKDTVAAVKAFQSAEAIAETGIVDQETLRCLDEKRAHRAVPCTLGTPLAEDDLTVSFEFDSLVREVKGVPDSADIFFPRGKTDLDAKDKEAIKKLFAAHKKEKMTLVGTRSEDEELDFPATLPDERVAAVDKELGALGHKKADRTLETRAESQGAIDFWQFRKVRIIPASSAAQQPDCSKDPAGWTQGRGPCDAKDDKVVKDNIGRGVTLMGTAITELKKKDAVAKQAVKDRFGGSLTVNQAITKLTKWKDFLDTDVRANLLCANVCHKACAGTGAYFDPPIRKTTICGGILTRGTVDDEAALSIAHEAGHGSLDTTDVAYDTSRLFASIQKDSLSKINTDSYIVLIRCLNGLTCGPPASKDTFSGFDPAKKQDAAAAEALAWLERWMDWVWQDVNNLYEALAGSIAAGTWGGDSRGTRDLLFKIFKIHRPAGASAAATRGEQLEVAAIHDRLRRMLASAGKDRDVKLDATAGATPSWSDSTKPSEAVVTPPFVKLSRRKQVETLLAALVHAMSDISLAAEPVYVKFVIADAKTWFDKP
jgi:hypothetical protein